MGEEGKGRERDDFLVCFKEESSHFDTPSSLGFSFNNKLKKLSYNLQIPQVAIDIMSNTTFADLTGCGAQCTFAQSVSAPSTSSCFLNLAYAGVRTQQGNETCLPPSAVQNGVPFNYNETVCAPWKDTTGWTLVPPTSIDATQACSDDWTSVSLFLKRAKERNEKTRQQNSTTNTRQKRLD